MRPLPGILGLDPPGVAKKRANKKANTQVTHLTPMEDMDKASTQPLLGAKRVYRKRKGDPQETLLNGATLASGAPGLVKRKPGRPKKIPQPQPALVPLQLALVPLQLALAPPLPALAPLSDGTTVEAVNTTKTGRATKKSEKASMEANRQAEKNEADHLAAVRKELKTSRADFSL